MASSPSSSSPSKVGRPETDVFWNSGMDAISVEVEQGQQLHTQGKNGNDKKVSGHRLSSCPTWCQPMGAMCPTSNCGNTDTDMMAVPTDDANTLDHHGMNELHYASGSNRLEDVRTLVEEQDADVNYKSRDGAIALHYAAKRRIDEDQNIEDADTMAKLISYLVKKGAKVNAVDKYISTPLHVAAMRGNTVVTKALLACRGIRVNAQDHLGFTPLMGAVAHNHINVVELLIKGACEITCRAKNGTTALHLAATTGNLDVVSFLADHTETNKDQFIQSTDFENNMALHFAVENGNTDVAKFLLSQGSGESVNAICRPHAFSSRPLHLACASKSGSQDIVKLLLEKGAKTDKDDRRGYYPIHVAAEYGNVEVAKLLLKQEEKHLDHRDKEGYTPLLLASCWDHPDMVQLLLKNGADITTSERNHRTAVFLAARYGHVNVLEKLLEAVNDYSPTWMRQVIRNAEDDKGNTPVHAAAENGFDQIIKKLLRAGAERDTKNGNEATPFIVAASKGQTDACKYLLKKTKLRCLNDSDSDSNTALHLAAGMGYLDVVQLLLRSDADAEARNSNLRTPLHFAAAAGHVDIVEVFIKWQIQLTPLDKSKATPLHLACKNGHLKVVRLLLKSEVNIFAEDNCGAVPRSSLDIAIQEGNEKLAAAILQSEQWKKYLMKDMPTDSGKGRCTPMRELIRTMPGIAKTVLDKCERYGKGQIEPLDDDEDDNDVMDDEKENNKVWVEYNFELLDDTWSRWDKSPKQNVKSQDVVFDSNGMPNIWATPYTRNSNIRKDNHPLMIMVKCKQAELVYHPVVQALIKHKWGMAKLLYFAYLFIYMMFACIVSAYLIKATPPYHPKVHNMTQQCQSGELGDVKSDFVEAAMCSIIFFLAAFGILLELVELTSTNIEYFKKLKNYVDLFTWVSAILVVIDVEECGAWTDWQWQLAAFCVFSAWLNMLLLMRKLPLLGIYVVMVVRILRTFIRVFAVFIFFIVAFALAFYVLLGNKVQFSGTFYSMMKTSVMMMGEIDFAGTFHADNNVYNKRLFYQWSTYGIFIAFLVLMSVIIMNLLTGLAVYDVKELRQMAELGNMKMQIGLALDLENAIPIRLMRWAGFIVRSKKKYVEDSGAVDKIVSIIQGDDKMDQSEEDPTERFLRRLLDDNLAKTTERLERIEHVLTDLNNQLNNTDSSDPANTTFIGQALSIVTP